MTELKFDRLSEREWLLWRMRYRYGWKMKRIALEFKMTESGVSKMLSRTHKRLGLPKYRVSVIRTKPRKVWAYSLSNVFNY